MSPSPWDFLLKKSAVFSSEPSCSPVRWQGSTPYLKQLDLDVAMPLEQQRHLRELQTLEVALMLGETPGGRCMAPAERRE